MILLESAPIVWIGGIKLINLHHHAVYKSSLKVLKSNSTILATTTVNFLVFFLRPLNDFPSPPRASPPTQQLLQSLLPLLRPQSSLSTASLRLYFLLKLQWVKTEPRPA